MKFKQRFLNYLGTMLFSFPAIIAAQSLPNLDHVKELLIRYHDSGHYYADIRDITRQAMYYVKYRVARNKESNNPKNLAAVFDIDETSLSNYPDMLSMNFGGPPQAINNAESLAHDPPLLDTLQLYNFTKNRGVTIFFVTGRTENQRQATLINLHRAGYMGWKVLFMKPNDYNRASVVPYKSAVRKKITAMGYDIILSIGDQWSDLQGGYADKLFKVPDPYYYIP
jgi:predicted secreted acid phosphatase